MTDTDLIAQADAALDGVTPDRCYLIKKNGLYYRPNCKGYTTSATQAGRYTLDEAIKESHPNGPDGPRDGMTYQHENDARDDDWLIVRELRQIVPALRDALAAERARVVALEAENARLRKATLDVRLFLDTGFTEMGDGRMTYSNVDILSMLDLLDRAALYGEPQP